MITLQQFLRYLTTNVPLPASDPVPPYMRLPNYDDSVSYDEFLQFIDAHAADKEML